MTNMELILNMLAEASTTEISKVVNSDAFDESRDVAKRDGNIAGNARKELEAVTGKSVISKKNSNIPNYWMNNQFIYFLFFLMQVKNFHALFNYF